jgi:hypothetical protein
LKIDLTRPNNGRMLDYWLGGSHNFEIDRQLADQVTSKMPIIKELAPKSRTLVRRGVEYFHAAGIRTILDFGSALPTCQNTHQVAEKLDPGLKVVYSDIDPITVAYSQEILVGNSHAIYLQCDAANPMPMLESPQVCDFTGGDRRVGIIFLNLAHTMPDEAVRSSWQALYEWVDPGSYLFINNASKLFLTDPELLTVHALHAKSSIVGCYRDPEEIRALAAPWKITAEGIVNQHAWYGNGELVKESRLLGYAAMLYK